MTFRPKNAAFAGASFLTGLLTQTSVNVVGNMPLAEIVILAILAVFIIRGAVEKHAPAALFRTPLFWIFIGAQVIAFGAYVFSDLYRGSATNDMLRGWSRMIFLGIDVIAFTSLFGTQASCFIWSQVGLMLGGVLAMFVDGVKYDAYWKFGLGGPATIAIFLVSPFFGRIGSIALICALGILHLSLDFRSMGGVCLLAAMFLCVHNLPRQFRGWILIPALVGGTALIVWMNNRQQGEDDARGNRSTVERTAMVVAASEAFLDSPLIGQGSWFSNSPVMENFQLLRSEGARLAGVHGYAVDADETNIAIHSQLLVSIAEGGILGGTFFVVFGSMLMWALWYCTVRRESADKLPFIIYFLLNATWNLFFSPFSGAHRIGIATGCGLIFLLWCEANQPATHDEESGLDERDHTELHEIPSMIATTTSTNAKH